MIKSVEYYKDMLISWCKLTGKTVEEIDINDCLPLGKATYEDRKNLLQAKYCLSK